MENGAVVEGRDPSSFLSEILGAPVTVKLNSGVVYKGKPAVLVGEIALTLDRRAAICRWLHEYRAGED